MDDERRSDCEIIKEAEAARAEDLWRTIIFFPVHIPFRILDKIMFHLACFRKEKCITTISFKRTEDDFIPQFENTDTCASLSPYPYPLMKMTEYILGVRVGYEEVEIFVDAGQYQKMSVGDIVQIEYRYGFLGPRAALI